jgi:hypothetical protein
VREKGRKVVTATWPGGDGADIRISGVVVQPAVPTRSVDDTGAFGGLGAQGLTLGGANFARDAAAQAALGAQLIASRNAGMP